MRKRLLIMVVTCGVVMLWSDRRLLDGLSGFLLAAALHDDTVYAEGYSAEGFKAVRRGMSEDEVRHLIGRPFGQVWDFAKTSCRVFFRDDKVDDYVSERCSVKGVRPRMSKAETSRLLGSAQEDSWIYSESPGDTHYRQRVISFRGERVAEIITGFYVD